MWGWPMKICSIEGCGNKHLAKELCLYHYRLTPKIKAYMSAYASRPEQKEKRSVRGLLCANCNTGLGMFSERQELLTKAAEYLNSHV